MRAMVPSSFMISQITAAGLNPASRGDVRAAFGLARAHQHAPVLGPEREDVAGGDDGFRACAVGHGSLHGGGAVLGRNAGGHAVAGLDGHGEVGAESRLVLLGHEFQAERVGHGVGHGQADQAASVGGHEVDGLGSDRLGAHTRSPSFSRSSSSP